MKNKTSAELKALARGHLSGRYRTLLPIMLFMQILAYAVAFTGPSASLFTVPGLIITFLTIFFSVLFLSLFRAGETYLFLKLSCQKQIQFGDLFYGLRTCPWKILGIQAVISLFHTGLSFLPMLAALTYVIVDDIRLLPLAILSLVICVPLDIFISLQYSQAFYIMLDYPQLSAMECLRFSRKLMHGHKGRKFYLELSFLPLNLIALFSCCIGSLFLDPYIYATNASFYLDLVQNRTKQPS